MGSDIYRGKAMDQVGRKYLTPTNIIDSDNEAVIRYALKAIGESKDPVDKAVKIYYAVRDGIYYDPYSSFYLPEHYRASNVLERGRGYCVSKASLLCALGRVCGIPSRIGFATVRNHLATKRLIERLGSDMFVYHAFTEFFLEGKWVKATPAFNKELCERHNVAPLDFNGREDSIFQPYNHGRRKFMDYVAFHGSYDDVPVRVILSAWKKAYGRERVQQWIDDLKKTGAGPSAPLRESRGERTVDRWQVTGNGQEKQ
jgi:transglutaminase-like putative cysteine protease